MQRAVRAAACLRVLTAALAYGSAAASLALPAVHEAARRGDIERLTKLLDRTPKLVSAREEAGWTPLHFAAQNGQDDAARLLIARGADLEARNARFGATPLHTAVSAGRESTIVVLLAAGANPSARDDDGWAPLHRAAISGFDQAAILLLAKGADPDAQSASGVTSAAQARERGHEAFAKRVLGFAAFRARTALPYMERFEEDCVWPAGERDVFAYGCEGGAYRLHLKQAGPVHVTQSFGWFASSLDVAARSQVASGRGTEPGKAMLGIGCLTDESHGYLGILRTDGSGGILRLDGDLIPLADGRVAEPEAPGGARVLRLVCEASRDGEATRALRVDGAEVATARDRSPGVVFNGVALYADTFPGEVTFERLVACESASQKCDGSASAESPEESR